jgi:hypothetical protein
LNPAARILTLRVMTATPADTVPAAPGPKHPVRVFLVANFFYLWVVHLWGLKHHAMGRDYAAMAHPERLPDLVGWVFASMIRAFGDAPLGYLLVNIFLLYGCMVGVFFLTRALLRGPWWLGSLSAVLMMSNPLKGEATLNLSGIQDLLPAFFAIWGLVLALWPFTRAFRLARSAAFVFVLIAGTQGAEYTFLPLVVLLLEHLVNSKRSGRLQWPILIPLLVYWNRDLVEVAPFAQAMLSLFLAVYPIGLLPGTAAALNASPGLALVAAIGIAAVCIALWRASRNAAVIVCAAAALLLFLAMSPVDLVHLAGGGKMLLPIALVAIAFAALCHRVMQHPQWPRHVVFLTSALCVVFFVLQIRAFFVWRVASDMVLEFQNSAKRISATGNPNVPQGARLGILPDFQFYRGAPLLLSESIRYDTPFSKAIPAESLLKLDLPALDKANIKLEQLGPAFLLQCVGAPQGDLLPYPYYVPQGQQADANSRFYVEWTTGHAACEAYLTPRDAAATYAIIPFRNGVPR